ncbi:MAG TPA: ferritin-like domain-containing protein [Candidatus Dormibacteraeota bacterium]|nr:ferritin-like domain-containing protein [Candidatus Dormibacteraeota bacterium]
MAAGREGNGSAPEPPLRVESREELVYLLGEACELEHGLLCEYLYAQFSLKRSVGEGVTPEQLARIQAWELTIIDVVKQEMLHLALATNILTAIGAAPHFERPNFPILSRWYPPDVQIALVPFGERALRHFMFLERPEGMPLRDAEGFGAVGQIRPLTVDDPQITAGAEEWHTVGHLYRGIETGLAHLVDRYGESNVFIGPAKVQATTQVFEWPQLTAVTNLASASSAIEIIVEQGEGARGDWVNSHFGKFVGILEDYLAVRATDPTFEPARPVIPAFLREPPDVDLVTLIKDPLTKRVADLFNAVYEVVLQVQSRYFVHHGETPEELETLALTAKHSMNWVMRKLGPIMTALPVGPEHPGRTAGPAFEIVRPAFFVLPHRDAAWRIVRERLETLAEVSVKLAEEPGLVGMKEIASNLRGFASDMGRHLEARAAATPIVTPT